MDDLIPITLTSIGGVLVPTVDARWLHSELEVQTDFCNWMPRRIEQLGLKNGNDLGF